MITRYMHFRLDFVLSDFSRHTFFFGGHLTIDILCFKGIQDFLSYTYNSFCSLNKVRENGKLGPTNFK